MAEYVPWPPWIGVGGQFLAMSKLTRDPRHLLYINFIEKFNFEALWEPNDHALGPGHPRGQGQGPKHFYRYVHKREAVLPSFNLIDQWFPLHLSLPQNPHLNFKPSGSTSGVNWAILIGSWGLHSPISLFICKFHKIKIVVQPWKWGGNSTWMTRSGLNGQQLWLWCISDNLAHYLWSKSVKSSILSFVKFDSIWFNGAFLAVGGTSLQILWIASLAQYKPWV